MDNEHDEQTDNVDTPNRLVPRPSWRVRRLGNSEVQRDNQPDDVVRPGARRFARLAKPGDTPRTASTATTGPSKTVAQATESHETAKNGQEYQGAPESASAAVSGTLTGGSFATGPCGVDQTRPMMPPDQHTLQPGMWVYVEGRPYTVHEMPLTGMMPTKKTPPYVGIRGYPAPESYVDRRTLEHDHVPVTVWYVSHLRVRVSVEIPLDLGYLEQDKTRAYRHRRHGEP